MTSTKKIYVITGGTINPIAEHLSLCAPAYGAIGGAIYDALLRAQSNGKARMSAHLLKTRMAMGNTVTFNPPSTSSELAETIEAIVADLDVKIIFMTAAVCDFEVKEIIGFGGETRLDSSKEYMLKLVPTPKILPTIRKRRKDIFLVACSATANATREEMFLKACRLMKRGHVNLVLANDTITKLNFIVTPEESIYHETTNRDYIIDMLVEMTLLRSNLTFTQSTVVDGKPVSWNDERVPENLRTVVDHCISRGAYKPIDGKTAGHFAVKLSDTEFLTSIRKTDFNDLATNGLVYVVTSGPDTVLAYGAKPSVGGQSQRIVFRDHPGLDCIVHFHCPKKPQSDIPVRSQREYECGSHECGKNTSQGLRQYGNIWAVMLENHGPNIVFSKNTPAKEIIDFIEEHFDLEDKTGPSWDKKPELEAVSTEG